MKLSDSEEILFPRIRIILIETTQPGNIGAAARAMKNMGLSRPYLVQPRFFPHEKAIWRSASATDVVEGAKVVASLDEALKGCQLIIGASARNRRIPWPMLEPRTCAEKIVAEHEAGNEIALVFGREAHGLKNEELQKCHHHVTIPTGSAYTSLNLAMAVQVLCYEILQAKIRHDPGPAQDWDVGFASAEAVEHFFVHFEQTLMELGFHDPNNPRQLMTRMRRLFNRVRMDKMEVNILRGFLTAIQKLTGSN